MGHSRKFIIAGNWKMHKTKKETLAFIQELVLHSSLNSKVAVYIAPPFTSIETAVEAAEETPICIGAQNMSEFSKGAYTGEISSEMLKEVGACFVILGHSERRQIFHENNQMIQQKLKQAIREKIAALLCIGETEKERDQKKTQSILRQQIEEAFRGLSSEEIQKVTIAYEPVWAIGTNRAATPEIAEEAHAFCREFLSERWGEEVAHSMSILYGGSVKPDNVGELIRKPNIDGALIGGASLDVDSFSQIIRNVEALI